MPRFRSDEIQWYNVGQWGELGYAVPNFGDDHSTLNNTIAELVSVMGRNLSAVMHHTDADLRVPPTINTLRRVHKLITRARTLLAGRAVPSPKSRFEATHATPALEPFLIYPVPYWRVRNTWLKGWCGFILMALSEAMQHTENRIEFEVSTDFFGVIGQYLQRVYVRMATELLMVPIAEAEKPDFVISEAIFAGYNPSAYFTATELIDTVPVLAAVPTEDDLVVITDGIPANMLTGVMRWPFAQPPSGDREGGTSGKPPATVAAAFAPPPAP
jgi:hypothetical protein